MKSRLIRWQIILFLISASLLDSCSVLPTAATPSPVATMAATSTPVNTLPTPTENTPAIPVTNTPVSAPPISVSNFQGLASLYQWNLASDIIKITGTALSPLGDKVALLTVRYPEQYSLELRDSKTGNLIWTQTLDAKADYPAVAFSPDGSLIAVGTGTSNITVWNVSDGSVSKLLKGASYAVRALAFSPDGNLIAAAGSDSMVHVWQVSDGTVRITYALKKNIGNLIFSPDSRYLATSSDVFAVYDLTSASNSPVIYYDALAPHPTTEIRFSFDSHYLIAEGELDDAGHNTWIPRILIWNLSSNHNTFRKIPLPNVIQNMIVLPDGQSILGYDASNAQLDLIDVPGKSVAMTINLGPILFMNYSANLSQFMAVTKTSVEIWGVPQ